MSHYKLRMGYRKGEEWRAMRLAFALMVLVVVVLFSLAWD